MITSSPLLAAMRLGVEAVERRHDFEERVLNLRRAREEAQQAEARRLEEARQKGLDDQKPQTKRRR